MHYGSPLHRVVEQQLLIPGFLPEFLEISGDQENLRFLGKVATQGIEPGTNGQKSHVLTITPQQLHEGSAQINIQKIKLQSFFI